MVLIHGLDKNFKKGDYVRIDPIYYQHPWYTNKLFKIENFVNNDYEVIHSSHPEPYYEATLNIKSSYLNGWKNIKTGFYELNCSLVVQDEICLRKEKLNKLKNIF